MDNYFPKTISEFVELFYRRKKLFFIPFFAVLGVTLLLYPFLPRLYKAQTLLFVEEDSLINPLVKGLAVSSNIPKKIKIMSAQVLSYANLSEMVRTFDMVSKGASRQEVAESVAWIQNHATIGLTEDNIIKVSYEDPLARQAQVITNAIAEDLVNWDRDRKKQEAKDAVEFIGAQLQVYKSKLDESERSFLLNKLNNKLLDARKKRELLGQNPVADKLQAQLMQEQVKLNRLLITAKEGHPLVQDLKSKIRQMERRLKIERSKDIQYNTETEVEDIGSKYQEAILKQKKELDIEIGTLKKKIQRLQKDGVILDDVSEQELLEMERNKEVNEDVYRSLLARLENANISEKLGDWGKGGSIAVFEPARLPKSPSKPNPVRTAGVGLFFAVFLGFGAIFTKEYFDSSFRGVQDAKSFLQLTFLGYITQIPNVVSATNGNGQAQVKSHANGSTKTLEKPAKSLALSPQVVTYHAPESKAAEHYRLIRTNLLSVMHHQSYKSLLVTSALQGEGKTTTSVNLAVSLANELNYRVLLIDADLRRGNVNNLLGLPPKKGLYDVLSGTCTVENAVVHSKETNLDVLSGRRGVSNPTRLFERKKVDDLMTKLNEMYDFIVIDAPPVLSLSDVPILASHMDGILFVVHSGQTRREQVQIAQSMIEQTRHANILGYILTQVEIHTPSYVDPYFSEA